jgi:hypothetical protein
MTKRRVKLRKDAVLHGGFKCDAEGCDYKEEPSIFDCEYLDEYISYIESYFDKKCPKCGAPLLIKKDFEQILLLLYLLHNPIIIVIEKLIGLFPGHKKTRYIAELDREHNLELKRMD